MDTQTETLTIATAGQDIAILKTERFDPDFARVILENKDVSSDERAAVRRLYKNRTNGNRHETRYKLGKDIKHEDAGRFHAVHAEGLQCLSRDCRSALAQRYYWDVDMWNAQPVLLEQLAIKHGWSCPQLTHYNASRDDYIAELMEQMGIERWEAKEKVCRLMFGGSASGMSAFFINDLQPEVGSLMRNVYKEYAKVYPSSAKRGERSLMAMVLQTIERKCLLAMDVSLTKQGRSLDVYIHDGGLVLKKDGETRMPDAILRQAEEDIFATEGFKVRLAVKELKTTLERGLEDEVIYVPSDVIVDDAFAATTLAGLLQGKLVRDGAVWVFDDTSGIWTTDETVLNRKMAVEFKDQLVFRQQKEGKVAVFNYSGDVAHQDRLRRALPTVLPDQKGYFKDRIETSVDKLLFADGIYDFKTGAFTEGFDPQVIFFGGVPRPFPTERNEEAIAYVRKVFFRDPFANPAVGDALLHWVSRAMAGHYEAKKVVLPYGPANSTKGTLCKHLDTTFGATLLGTFTGDSLLMRSADTEATKALSWIKPVCDKRIAYSNEITVDPAKRRPINGNLLKTLSGGGDGITLRTNHRDEEVVVNKSLLFIFVNDLPDISPVDGSVRDRLVTIPYTFSFVDTPLLPCEKKRDHTISKTLKTDTYRDATIHLILDTMKAWNGEPFILPEECNALKNDLAPMSDLRELLTEEYDLTGNEDDYVPSEELVSYLRSRKVDGSDRKISDRLSQIGLPSLTRRDGRRVVRVRTGIRRAGDV
jgi:hypothetical protein